MISLEFFDGHLSMTLANSACFPLRQLLSLLVSYRWVLGTNIMQWIHNYTTDIQYQADAKISPNFITLGITFNALDYVL